MNHKKINKDELNAAIKEVGKKLEADLITIRDTVELTEYFEALQSGHLESAAQTYEWAFDTYTRETAYKILNTVSK